MLVAATPVCHGVLFEVRPDMLGVALQTTGIVLVLSGLLRQPASEARLIAALACFAMAMCIKQQFVIAPLVSLVVIVAACARGRAGRATLDALLSIGLAIVVVYYGAEEWMTAGRMSRSIVVAAARVRTIHPADW